MLISISGIDGCGKTLQVNMLQSWLQNLDRTCVTVKAYDDTAKIACRPFMDTWTSDTAIMFLFQALHAQQYALTIQALTRGDIVITDRWDESYLAYHENFGFLAEQLEIRSQLNTLAFHGKLPDIGFIIDVPPEIARRRRESRGKVERFEDRSDQYYETVRVSYRRIATARNWTILNGTKTPESIHQEIIAVLQNSKLFL